MLEKHNGNKPKRFGGLRDAVRAAIVAGQLLTPQPAFSSGESDVSRVAAAEMPATKKKESHQILDERLTKLPQEIQKRMDRVKELLAKPRTPETRAALARESVNIALYFQDAQTPSSRIGKDGTPEVIPGTAFSYPVPAGVSNTLELINGIKVPLNNYVLSYGNHRVQVTAAHNLYIGKDKIGGFTTSTRQTADIAVRVWLKQGEDQYPVLSDTVSDAEVVGNLAVVAGRTSDSLARDSERERLFVGPLLPLDSVIDPKSIPLAGFTERYPEMRWDKILDENNLCVVLPFTGNKKSLEMLRAEGPIMRSGTYAAVIMPDGRQEVIGPQSFLVPLANEYFAVCMASPETLREIIKEAIR